MQTILGCSKQCCIFSKVLERRASSTSIADLQFSTSVKHSSTSEAGQGIQHPVRTELHTELQAPNNVLCESHTVVEVKHNTVETRMLWLV